MTPTQKQGHATPTFGEYLRRIRRQQKINQRTLAAIVDVDFTYICKIETGVMPPPSEEVLDKLALILEDDYLYVLAGKVPETLKTLAKDNPLLTELLILLSKKRLPDGTYQLLIELCKEAQR